MALNYSPNIIVKTDINNSTDCKYLLAKDEQGNAVLVDIESIFCSNLLLDLNSSSVDWTITSEDNKLITLRYLSQVLLTDEYRSKFKGVQGFIGLQGARGIPGTEYTGTGVKGIQGYIGIQGYRGLQGGNATWDKSIQGIQGLRGTQGTKSSVIGIQGPDGYIGNLSIDSNVIMSNLTSNGFDITKQSDGSYIFDFGIITNQKITANHFYQI